MGTFVVKLSHDLPPKIYTLRLDAWFSVTFMIKHSYIRRLECQSLHSDSKPCLECVVKETLVLNVKSYDIKKSTREEVGRSFCLFFGRICWIFFIKVPNNPDVLKFGYSEKATKMWNYLPSLLSKRQSSGWLFQILWPS